MGDRDYSGKRAGGRPVMKPCGIEGSVTLLKPDPPVVRERLFEAISERWDRRGKEMTECQGGRGV